MIDPVHPGDRTGSGVTYGDLLARGRDGERPEVAVPLASQRVRARRHPGPAERPGWCTFRHRDQHDLAGPGQRTRHSAPVEGGVGDRLVAEGMAMVPQIARTRFIRAFSGVRPLLMAAGAEADGRKASRGFSLFDHESDGLANFATVAGGKLTTCRLMAERAADLVCLRLGVTRPCLTAMTPLPVAAECAWTEPGRSPREWMRSHARDDTRLCECEMVPGSAVDAIYAALRSAGDMPTLTDIGLRSRVGKGACQGAFCAPRAVAHLYNRGDFQARRGIEEIIDFFGERWRGQRAVLWGEQLAQAELMEALHCGLFGEELRDALMPDAPRAAPNADPAGKASP